MNLHSLKSILLFCTIGVSLFVLYSWNNPSIVTQQNMITQGKRTEIDPRQLFSQSKLPLINIGSVDFIRKDPRPKSEPKRAFYMPNLKYVPYYKPPKSPNTSVACHFPDQDPYDGMVMMNFERFRDTDCTRYTFPSVVYLDGDNLRVNWTKVRRKGIQIDKCVYKTLSFYPGSDILYRASNPNTFVDSTPIKSKHENIFVTCFQGKQEVSRTYLTRIVKKNDTEKFCKENFKRHVIVNLPRESLSVLLVGIDGTSRQNSIRSMPRLREFLLTNMSAIEFYRFNKVGENTWPNILPLVTGLHVEDLVTNYHWTPRSGYDSLNQLFLWHDYKEAGYRTALVMDHLYMNPFHYLKRAWTYPPFDYYHRLMTVLRNDHGVKRKECVGDIPEATFLLDYWLQLTSMFNNTPTTPYFALSFLMRVTHDDPNKATVADKIYLDFFRSLVERNLLQNTVVVFFSDHGARFGPIRRTKPGMFETNTPLLFFMFPAWFHAKYPEVIATLRTNQHRLTTMFDVHATLKDLLRFSGTTGKGNLQSRGISLFKEIPAERLCHHAGISEFFCMCSTGITVSEDMSHRLAHVLLEHTNKKTEHIRHRCGVFRILRINYVFQMTVESKCEGCSYYRAAIRLTPGGTRVIEGVLEHDAAQDTIRVIKEQKLTRHWRKSDRTCLQGYPSELRDYCYCIV